MTEPNFKTPKKRRKKGPKTRQLEACDALFSKIVRSVGCCEQCGTTEWLQCAHGFSRRYRATRWERSNAWCLCRGCHKKYTERPLEWDDWMLSRLGTATYAWLRGRALAGPNPDMDEVLQELKALWAEIEEAA